MKPLSAMAPCLVIAAVILASPGESRAELMTIDISLNGSREVPPNLSTATGTLIGTFDTDTNTLDFDLTFSGLVGTTTAAHFHAPAAPGVNAAIVVGFAGFPVGVATGGYSNAYVLSDTQETDLLAGLWYVNVHTNVFPGGEIRGQLQESSAGSFDVALLGSKEVPPNVSSAAGGLTGTYDTATNTLSFSLQFNGLSAGTTAAHFHAPAAPGANAAVVIALAGFPIGVTAGGYSNAYVLTDAQEADLLAGLWYLNIHTSTFPGGEIRGQVAEGRLSAVTAVTAFSGPSATGTGTINASFTGGGPGCTFTSAEFIGAPPGAPPIPPVGVPAVTFPHGLFTFALSGCTSGSTVVFTIVYPLTLPAGTQYWKYGPTSGDPSNHWYVLPAAVAGETVTFSLTDGGLGDDDLAANGAIADQGGPGAPQGGSVIEIPTLDTRALAIFVALLLALGILVLRRRA